MLKTQFPAVIKDRNNQYVINSGVLIRLIAGLFLPGPAGVTVSNPLSSLQDNQN